MMVTYMSILQKSIAVQQLSESKLNYHMDHYETIARITNSFQEENIQEENIEEYASQNLKRT